MAEPSGKIVARPMVVRACGHQQEFQHYEVDKYRAQRLAKFQQTRCAQCAAKLVEEQRRAAQTVPKKREVLNSLPPGTLVSLTLQQDRCWAGTLSADGRTVAVAGVAGAGVGYCRPGPAVDLRIRGWPVVDPMDGFVPTPIVHWFQQGLSCKMNQVRL